MNSSTWARPRAPFAPAWTVAALVRAIGDTLGGRFGPVTVTGEVSGFLRAGSGHCYFTLKDDSAQLRCVLFRQQALRLDFEPRDGDQVELRGSLTVYAARGTLQLVAESLVRAGQGALLEQFLRLKAKLTAEGLFAAERKRPLPASPRAIGLVTSCDAAALHDVMTTLRRRAPQIPVLLAPASVQGSAAPAQLAAALRALYVVARRREPLPLDVILLVRGGGSLEDLWAFNDETLARVIAASPVPVVSGVGHETDFTIADFTADVRAATPTAAAELAAPARADLLQALDALQRRLQQQLAARLHDAAQQLDGLALRWGRPGARLAQERLRLTHLRARLATAALRWTARAREQRARLDQSLQAALRQRLRAEGQALPRTAERWRLAWAQSSQLRRARLDQLELRLRLLDPRRPLSRGYAWLQDANGQPVTRAARVIPGSALRAILADGSLDTMVTGRHLR